MFAWGALLLFLGVERSAQGDTGRVALPGGVTVATPDGWEPKVSRSGSENPLPFEEGVVFLGPQQKGFRANVCIQPQLWNGSSLEEYRKRSLEQLANVDATVEQDRSLHLGAVEAWRVIWSARMHRIPMKFHSTFLLRPGDTDKGEGYSNRRPHVLLITGASTAEAYSRLEPIFEKLAKSLQVEGR